MESQLYFSPLRLKALLIALVFGGMIFLVSSCHIGRCTGCQGPGGLAFFHFSRTDLDTVIVKHYVRGSNFTILRDSLLTSVVAGDSAPYLVNLILNNLSDTMPDMLVYLPADTAIYKITNITITINPCLACPDQQLPAFGGYAVNGIQYYQDVYNPQNLGGGYLSIYK